MNYNSIYGNTFKLQSNNNIMNLPDFFYKLIINSKKAKEKEKKIKITHSQYKGEKSHELNRIESDENIKNNKLFIKKKYDLILDKKNDFLKRKNSALNLLKFRNNRIMKEEDTVELKNKREVLKRQNEKIDNIDIIKKSKINDNIKILLQKSIKNQKFSIQNKNSKLKIENLIKKKISSNFPNLSKSHKKINNKQDYEINVKENYANLTKFLGHLYYMQRKYKSNKDITQNLILSNSKNGSSGKSMDGFKEQVNNLINKLKNKNKENNNKKSLNLCIVNVCSPINRYQSDVITLTRSLIRSKNRNENYMNNYFEQNQNHKHRNLEEKQIYSKKYNNNSVNNNNNNNNTIKIDNVNKYIKNCKTSTDFRKINSNSNRRLRNRLIKKNNSKTSIPNGYRNKSSLLSQKYNTEKKENRVIFLNHSKNFYNKYTSEKMIERLFSKKIIISNFDRRFSNEDTYYYKLNKMYYNQISLYMAHRINWELVDNSYDDFDDSFSEQKLIVNFEWKYYPNKLYYKKYQYNSSTAVKKLCAINLFEKNYEIGNKKKMFMHLINYCDKINLNVFNYVPFTIIINNTRFIDDELQALKEIMDSIDLYTNNFLEGKNLDFISNKKYNVQFWFDSKLEMLKNQNIFINKNFLSNKNYWILKPTDLYQGKCIEISNSYEELSKKCKKLFTGVDKRIKPEIMEDDKKENNEYFYNNEMFESFNEQYDYDCPNKKKKKSNIYISNELIIQKYLDNPLLYRKRKFDIRCFVLVDWNLNIFYCREGHLKASSFIYDINNINKFIHITNHSFQKKSNRFEQFETGNEISYKEFKNFLQEEKIPLSIFDKIINKMKFIVKLSFQAVAEKLMKTQQVLSFELFGYDFIIDNEYNPWLLEINNNPGLSISSPVIAKIIPRMMDDAFRLTIDKIFNTRYSNECFDKNKMYKSKFKLEGYSDYENIFEFLCNVKSSRSINSNEI